MKRREFMKAVGVGLSGLIGLERLVKAISGDPAYARANCYVNYTCKNGIVSCGYDSRYGYGFECRGGYECNAQFKCADFGCIDETEGDGFGCKGVGFQCPGGSNSGQRFDCQGSDYSHAQFYCQVNFYCQPKDRFGCDDFKCEEGNYHCSTSIGTLSAYSAPIVPPEV